MMNVVDYMFYRVYSFYKQKKDATPFLMGCLVLAVVFSLTLLTVFAIIEIITKSQNKISKYILVPVVIVLIILFAKRYAKEKTLEKLKDKYDGESRWKKSVRGTFILLYVLLVTLFPIAIGILRHNFGLKI